MSTLMSTSLNEFPGIHLSSEDGHFVISAASDPALLGQKFPIPKNADGQRVARMVQTALTRRGMPPPQNLSITYDAS